MRSDEPDFEPVVCSLLCREFHAQPVPRELNYCTCTVFGSSEYPLRVPTLAGLSVVNSIKPEAPHRAPHLALHIRLRPQISADYLEALAEVLGRDVRVAGEHGAVVDACVLSAAPCVLSCDARHAIAERFGGWTESVVALFEFNYPDAILAYSVRSYCNADSHSS